MMHPSAALLLLALAQAAVRASPIAARAADLASSSQNDLKQQGINSSTNKCAQNIIIFARGTTELGNVGSLAGPPLFQAVAQQVGPQNLAVQGVDYPADIAGFFAGGDNAGSRTMAQLTQQAVQQCPQSKVVLSCYSQGCQLAHKAAAQLPADVSGKVAGVVLFGDPDNGQPLQGISADKTKGFCHTGDVICKGQPLVLAPHLTYSTDAGTAAQFVASL